MGYDQLKSAIRQAVKANGNNEITGDLLQETLLAIVNALNEGSIFGGVATQIINPRNQDPRKFYIAEKPGQYPLFDGLTVPEGKIGIFTCDANSSTWYLETVDIPVEAHIPEDAFFPVMPDEEANYNTEVGKLIFTSVLGQAIVFNANNTYNLYSIAVSEGDKFFLSTTIAAVPSRVYAFVDENERVLEVSNIGIYARSAIITAPAGAVKLYCSCLNNVTQGFSLKKITNYRCFANDMSRYKWAVLGDSLSDISINAPNKYQLLIYDETRIRLQNLAVGGSGYWRNHASGTSLAFQATQVENDADIVTLFGSINDWSAAGSGVPNGTPTDTIADNTLSGYMNDAIDKVMAAAPKAIIVLVSAMYFNGISASRQEELCATLKAVAEYRQLPFVDMLHTTMFNRIADAAFAEQFTTDYSTASETYGHPSDLAHKVLIAPRFLDILNTYLPIRRQ